MKSDNAVVCFFVLIFLLHRCFPREDTRASSRMEAGEDDIRREELCKRFRDWPTGREMSGNNLDRFSDTAAQHSQALLLDLSIAS